MSYETFQPSLHPTGLHGAWGGRWGAALGREKDALLPVAKDAVKGRCLSIASDDALPYIGRDRVIPSLPGEPAKDYRDRLLAAWSTWSRATTELGLREAIVLAGYGGPTFYTERQLHRPPRPDWWSRFTLVFSGRFVWDGGIPWDASAPWDGRWVAPIESLSEADIRVGLRTILSTWKSAHDRVTSVVIGRGAWLWDTGDTWDSGVTWDAGDGWSELAAEPWDSGARWDSGWCWDYFL